jgi:alpha-ketoglutarate-dependent taurine dioxygenase
MIIEASSDFNSISIDINLLDKLDALIIQNQEVIKLEKRDCLILNNRKVLHGRGSFSYDSDRHLKRVRLNNNSKV